MLACDFFTIETVFLKTLYVTERVALPAGDYAVASGDGLIATVERKTFENLTSSLSDGTLAFQMGRLDEVGIAAVVVEGHYSGLFKLEHVPGAFLADGLARLQVRYPEIQIVFADARKFAEEWICRFLAAALADATRMPTSTARSAGSSSQSISNSD